MLFSVYACQNNFLYYPDKTIFSVLSYQNNFSIVSLGNTVAYRFSLENVNILSGQSLVHTTHGTELSAHAAGVAVILLR